tara:strand:+ start:400 stop:954 length:555 start_codon:yes stop_codon:yes gene_type:complete
MKITKKKLQELIQKEIDKNLGRVQEVGMSIAALKSSDPSGVPTNKEYAEGEIDNLIKDKSKEQKLDWLESRYMDSPTSPCRRELAKKNNILEKNCAKLKEKALSIRGVDSSMTSESVKNNLKKIIEEELMLFIQEQTGEMSGGEMSGGYPRLKLDYPSFGRNAKAIEDNFTQILTKLDLILSKL